MPNLVVTMSSRREQPKASMVSTVDPGERLEIASNGNLIISWNHTTGKLDMTSTRMVNGQGCCLIDIRSAWRLESLGKCVVLGYIWRSQTATANKSSSPRMMLHARPREYHSVLGNAILDMVESQHLDAIADNKYSLRGSISAWVKL